MDLIWSHLLPTMDKTKTILPQNKKAQTDLKQRLKNLTLAPPKGSTSSPVANRVSGKIFTLEPNEFNAKTFQLHFSENSCDFTLNDDKGNHKVSCGINTWVEQKNDKKGTPFPVSGRMDVTTAIAGSVTWPDDNTLLMTWRLMESAHTNGLTFSFEDNDVTIKFHSSISLNNPKAPDKRANLKGSIAS